MTTAINNNTPIGKWLSVHQIVSSHQWSSMVYAFQMTGIQNLINGFMGILCIVVGIYIMYRLRKVVSDSTYSMDAITIAYIGMFMVGIIMLFALVHSINELKNVWNWVAFFHPQAYAMHQIISQQVK